MSVSMLAASPAYANPEGGVVASGAATISASGSKLDVHQHTNKAVIDWRSFDIDVGEHTQFHQPGANATILNRVNSNDPSRIAGKLSANGNVILINPNGVFFGAGSQVDVNSLVVSTADITNDNFMAGNLQFDRAGNANAKIVNAGSITAKEAGLIGLVAPQVENHGVIRARFGRVQLASADTFAVDMYGDGLINIAVSDDVSTQLIANTGNITAEGGMIALTAAAGKDIVNSLITVAGELKAPSVAQQNGKIIIGNAQTNSVRIAGDVSANNIRVRGDDITLAQTARLAAQGGVASAPEITVGGAYLGGDGIGNANTVTVEHGARIIAGDAANGDAGEIIVWSDDHTRFDGYAEAGFVETSGKVTLSIGDDARVNTHGGLWLLDPQNFTIAASGGDISTATLTANLALGDVSILSSGGGAAGDGDIIIADAFGWNANRLTLTAARDVLVQDVVSVSGTGALTVNTATTNGGDTGVAGGALKMALGPAGFTGRIDYSASGSLIMNGNTYTVINSLGVQGSTTGTDLQGINGNLSGYYVLGSNIDASATVGWNTGQGFDPIGGVFTGSFNGLGHTVDNLYIDNFLGIDQRGLFSNINGATLSNVGITNINIASSRNFVGALVGWVNGNSTIRNSYSTGTVNGNGLTGGLVGYMLGGNNHVIDSYSSVDVTATTQQIGGLVGDSSGTNTITRSYATGDLLTSGAQVVGGLVGYNRNGSSIIDSYATGTVTASQNSGGLVGANENNSSIANSYATGDVTGTGNIMGGLVGRNVTNATISNSHAIGTVQTTGGIAGGLVGFNFNGSSITTSYATGSASGTSQVGGLVGQSQNNATISDSYATGSATGGSQVGGLAGENRDGSSITGSYATGDAIGTGGTGMIGGLVGMNRTGAITDSYATGNVISVGFDAGGLVGYNFVSASVVNSFSTGTVSGIETGGLIGDSAVGATVTNSFWNTTTSGQATSAGGTGITTAQMMQEATFSGAGWDVADTGGGATVWRIYEGNTNPLLASFMTDLALTANDSVTFTGAAYSPSVATIAGTGFKSGESVANLLGAPVFSGNALGATEVGSYTLGLSGYFSGQQGYDISFVDGVLTINPEPVVPVAPAVDLPNTVEVVSQKLVAPSITDVQNVNDTGYDVEAENNEVSENPSDQKRSKAKHSNRRGLFGSLLSIHPAIVRAFGLNQTNLPF